jgi:hypothetical protein
MLIIGTAWRTGLSAVCTSSPRPLASASRGDELRVGLLQLDQLVHQRVVLAVRDRRPGLDVVAWLWRFSSSRS